MDWRGEVGDVFRDWVLRVNGIGIDVIVFVSFRYGIVIGVEVFVVFEVFGEVVGVRGEFVVEMEEVLFFWGEGLLRYG